MTTKTGQALQVRPFVSSSTLIPAFENGVFTGLPYKAELVLFRGANGGARQHVWFQADPRPHNHPWAWIDCKVLVGKYTSVEYIPNDAGSYDERTITLNAGDPEHRLVYEAHHQVVLVEPGTISVMSRTHHR